MAAQTRFEEIQHQKDVNMEGGNLMELHPYTKKLQVTKQFRKQEKTVFPRDKFPNFLFNINWTHTYTYIYLNYNMNVYELIYVQVTANWLNKAHVFML